MGCPTGHHPRTNRVVMSRVATSSRWTLHSKKKTKTPTMSPRENDDDSWRASDGNFEHQATAVDQMEAATPQRDEAGVGDATETSSGTNQQSVVEAMDDLALTEVKFFQGDRCMYVAEQGGEEGVQHGGGGNIFLDRCDTKSVTELALHVQVDVRKVRVVEPGDVTWY